MTTASKYTITNDNFKSIYPNNHDILINDLCNYNKDTKHKSLYYDYYEYFYNSMTKYLNRNKISSCKNAIYNRQFKTHLKYRFNPPTKLDIPCGAFQNLRKHQQHIYLKHDYKQQKGRIEQDIINYRFNEGVGLKKATDQIIMNWLFDKDKAYLNSGDIKKYIINNDICFNYQQEYLINVDLSNDNNLIGLIIRLFYNQIYLKCYINEYNNKHQTFKDYIDDYIIKYTEDDTIYKFIEVSTPKDTFDYLIYNLKFCRRMMRIKYINKFSYIDKTALHHDIKEYHDIKDHKKHLLNRGNVLNEFNNIHYTKQRQKNIYLSLHNHKVFKKRVLEKESEDFIYNVLFIAQNNIINTFKNKECSICYCNVDDDKLYFYKCNKCDAKICGECKQNCDSITFIHDYNEPEYNTDESVNISFKSKCSVCMTKNSVEKIKNLNYKHTIKKEDNEPFDLIRYLRANKDNVKDALTDAYYKYQENHFITYTESLYYFQYGFVRDYLRSGISEDAYICICEKEDLRMLLDVCYTEQGLKDLLEYLFYHYEYNENIDENLRELGDDFYNDYLKEAFIEYDLDELINNCDNNEDVLNELLEITTDIHDKYESGFFYSIYDDKNDIDINNIVNSAINAFDDCY